MRSHSVSVKYSRKQCHYSKTDENTGKLYEPIDIALTHIRGGIVCRSVKGRKVVGGKHRLRDDNRPSV